MRRLAIIALTLAAASALPAQAWGLYSRARVMSATPVELALSPDGTAGQAMSDPVLSADGRFVAFETRVRNLFTGLDAGLRETANGGVLRREVDGSALEVVAPGPATTTPVPLGLGLAISADGRHVAFSSAVALAPEDADTARDVYVRDMAVPRTAPGAFTLVSPGADDGRDYVLPPGGGAMSTDGRAVLYTDLGAASAPAGLHLRRLATGDAVEISATAAPPTSGYGGAALSGDGSTVAWIDTDPERHVAPGAFLPGEVALGGLAQDFAPRVANADLLWTRVGSGPARRVAASGDSENPACPAGAPLAPDVVGLGAQPPRGPCDGPFSQAGLAGTVTTAAFGSVMLSFTGDRVGYVTRREFRGGPPGADGGQDLFVRDMAAPGGRRATTRELTRFTPPPTAGGDAAPPGVASATLDATGTQAAFTTSERTFSLPVPSLISPTLPPAASSVEDVYTVDLDGNVLERASQAYDGTPIARETGAALASRVGALSAGGQRIAFRSNATNILFGDSNGLDDVFVADRFRDTSGALPQEPYAGASGGMSGRVFPVWRLSVTVSRGGRTLYVDARVPGAGTLTATARTYHRRRSRKRSKSGRVRWVRPVVATSKGRTREAGEQRLRLRLRSTYLPSARRGRGLRVRVTVTFRPSRQAGQPAVTELERLRTSTYRVKKAKKAKQRTTRKGARR